MLLLGSAWPSLAIAEVTLGVFAPAAQFPSVQARIQLGESLAAHLGGVLSEARVRTRVYARRLDFEAAVRDGTIALALVDASYLALLKTRSTATVVAAGPDVQWRLVASKRYTSVSELRGKRLILANGGLENELAEGLFDGEARRFFQSITQAQDSASAVAALGLGKADAALVPMFAAQRLSDELTVLVELGQLPGLLLVAFPSILDPARQRVADSIEGFRGDAPAQPLRVAGGEVLTTVRARLNVREREAPMPSLALRVLVDSLVAAPMLGIAQRPATDFAITPTQAAAQAAAQAARAQAATSARPAGQAPTSRQ